MFDLHCDTLTDGAAKGVGLISDKLAHFSLDRLPGGMRWCQCTAVFMPDELRGAQAERYFEQICDYYDEQCALYKRFITPVIDTAAVESALVETPFAFILTVEGGSALAGRLENLEKLHGRGVRMMTLTWNGANEIAGGAATDQGFTPLGREVVAGMERLRMVVDVSHLCDRAFWELCEFAQKPFAASHSNSRAVCGHRRNLTDEQFREIVRRGGVVGINYADMFLVDGGGSKTVDDLLRHIHRFLELGGERAVALGSDFDGADVPPYLEGLDKMGVLADTLERSGIPAGTVDDILFGNANRFFTALAGSVGPFPFADGPDTPVLLCRHLLEGAPLFRVYHLPGEDPKWHLLCRESEHFLAEGVRSTLGETLRRFPEIAELAGIPADQRLMLQRGQVSGHWIDFIMDGGGE